MVMEKKLNQMASKQQRAIGGFLLFFIVLSLLYCNSQSNKKEEAKTNLANHGIEKEKFIPDTTVNNILVLNNPESSVRFLPSINKLPLIERERESPIVILANKTQSEYLLLYQFEGATLNSYSKFEIISIKEYTPTLKATETIYENFISESGLRLNMTLDEVIAKKGNDFIREDDKIIYRINSNDKSDFLKRYNMPGYSMEFSFKEGHLYKLIYGFDYP